MIEGAYVMIPVDLVEATEGRIWKTRANLDDVRALVLGKVGHCPDCKGAGWEEYETLGEHRVRRCRRCGGFGVDARAILPLLGFAAKPRPGGA